MTTIVTVLTDGFADWETAMLNAVAGSFYGVRTRFASPGAHPVRSAGGMTVLPADRLEDLDVDTLDALVLCGGTIWQRPDAPDVGGLLRAARSGAKVVGLICDATVAAARSGILDEVSHTSNAKGYLDPTGYGGKPLYRDVPHAVADRGIVTAPGTAPVSFMAETMRQLGFGDANLDYYVGLHAAQFGRPARAAA